MVTLDILLQNCYNSVDYLMREIQFRSGRHKMIELENVSMTYPGGIEAIKNVNINIEKGEFVFIVGSSGSGKTTHRRRSSFCYP